MRILHTSDWHLGKTLEGRSRFDEQVQFIKEFSQIADDSKADLVLIAGDIFDTVNPPASAEALFYDGLEILASGGRRAVVVIAGNHDNPERLTAAVPLAERHGITLVGLPKSSLQPSSMQNSRGKSRTYTVAGGPSWVKLAIPGSEHEAVILALPYPSEARLKEILSEDMDEGEIAQAYSARVASIFKQLSAQYRTDTVNLAMSHLYVAGGLESDSERKIQIGGAPTVAPEALPSLAQYIALGHLHRPQAVNGTLAPARYSGSPLAYSFSEAGQVKSVVLIDAKPGEKAVTENIPLTSGRPLVRWQATAGLPQVRKWCEEERDANAWIELELHLKQPLTAEERHSLLNMHPLGFVLIRPVFPETMDFIARENRQGLGIDELFKAFYAKQYGQPPEDDTVKLFMELIDEQATEEEGGAE